MINDDKVTSNGKKYFEVGKENGFLNDKLISFLGADFVNAPASTRTSYTGCYKGGLVDTTLQIAKHMVKANNNLPTEKQIDKAKVMKVAFLHQIGKAKLFVPNEDSWRQEKLGEFYGFNEDLTSMRTSERSVYYALSHGINLDEDEYQAILNYDKSSDDAQSKAHNGDLGRLLRVGNEMVEIEKGDNNG